MIPILFTIPIPEWLQSFQLHFFNTPVTQIPIYGYGLMLFIAYLATTALGKYLCKREGINPNLIPDLAIWFFVGGIIGSRIVYVVEYWDKFKAGPYARIFMIWDGGLVFYGGVVGGTIAYFAYDYFVLRKAGVSKWKMIDVIAPCVVLGSALGRIGCLCTGCCYGGVACESCPALHFPVSSPAALDMIANGYQTPQGFLLERNSLRVAMVEPGSAAANAGLMAGDDIVEINGNPVRHPADILFETGALKLTVFRAGEQKTLEPFTPTSIGVNPTQIYETISMSLLLFFMLSYFPFRRWNGELMVFLMFGYGLHRFLNEMLRADNEVVAFGLTLSQNVSLAALAAGVVLAIIVYRRPPIAAEPPMPASPVESATA